MSGFRHRIENAGDGARGGDLTGSQAGSLARGGWFRFHLPPILMAAVVLLYPFSRMAELPLMVMALTGLWLLMRNWSAFWDLPSARTLGILFLCWWGPVVLSAADSATPVESWRVAAALLRFFLVGVFALWCLRDPEQLLNMARWCAWILVFWIIDALVQAIAGVNLLGMTEPERLNGVFGEHHLKLGPVLAVLLPLLFEYARGRWPGWVRLLLLMMALSVVLLTGTRSAWITLAVLLAIYVFRTWRRHPGKGLRVAMIAIVLSLASVVLLYQFHDGFHQRADRTLRVLDGDMAGVDAAISARLPIWRTATEMIVAHPVNGVGVRGFRSDYVYHSGPDDPWVNRRGEGGALYAHHYLLEVLSETGVIGLIGLIGGLLALLQRWSLVGDRCREMATPYAIALLLAFFPFNTHYAIYSTFWSILLWWLLIACLSALNLQFPGPAPDRNQVTEPGIGPGIGPDSNSDQPEPDDA